MARGMLSGIIAGTVVTVFGLGTASIIFGPDTAATGSLRSGAETPAATPAATSDRASGAALDTVSGVDPDAAGDDIAAPDGDAQSGGSGARAPSEASATPAPGDGSAEQEAEPGAETGADRGDTDTTDPVDPVAAGGETAASDGASVAEDAEILAGDGDSPVMDTDSPRDGDDLAEAPAAAPETGAAPDTTLGTSQGATLDETPAGDSADTAMVDVAPGGGTEDGGTGDGDPQGDGDTVVSVESEDGPEQDGPEQDGPEMAGPMPAELATADPSLGADGEPDSTPDSGTPDSGTLAQPAPETDDAPAIAAATTVEPELEDPAAGVVTGRLPSIGGGATPVAAKPAADPAILRNAIAFDAAGDGPLMSILLLDAGGDRAALGDLGKLPFPITVAVDASAPDAAEAEAFYREVGAEVVLVLPLPEGATATDVDVTLEAYGPLLEPVTAVLVDEASGFQTLGPAALQVATNLAESGHGLVTFPAGLNTGHKAAVKEGVKAGMVFRDLDGEGQAGPVVRRFLDNAAFRARNEDGVIVIARTRPETLQALLEWSLGNRAQAVRLAPISAVLTGGK